MGTEMPSPLTHSITFEPQDKRSKQRLNWIPRIEEETEIKWIPSYTDGNAAGGKTSAGGWQQESKARKAGAYLGEPTTIADGGPQNMIWVLPDSTASVHGTINLAAGNPPTSDIEVKIKHAPTD